MKEAVIGERLKKKLLHHLRVSGEPVKGTSGKEVEGHFTSMPKRVQNKLVRHFTKDEKEEICR